MVVGKEAFMKRAEKHRVDGMEAGIIVMSGNEVVYRTGTKKLPGEELVGGICGSVPEGPVPHISY